MVLKGGIKALSTMSSPKTCLNRFGKIKARVNASAILSVPKNLATIISLTNPKILEMKVPVNNFRIFLNKIMFYRISKIRFSCINLFRILRKLLTPLIWHLELLRIIDDRKYE